MRCYITLCLLLCALTTAGAQSSAGPVTLFDFEAGVDGWWGNPWGGGQCAPGLSAQAKFGQGALRATYTDIKQGGNIICPYFPAAAPWRGGDYDTLVLWLKGDASQSFLNLYLACEEGDNAPVYSAQLPLDSKQWRRFAVKLGTLWSRQSKPFVLRDFRRLYFGVTGTHEVLIDHIGLQSPLRQVPLKLLDNGGPAAIDPQLYANAEGRYLLTFDPVSVLVPTVTVELSIAWPLKGATRLLKTLPARTATDEAWVLLPGMPDAQGPGQLTLKLKEPAGTTCYTGSFNFPVALEALRLDPTPLQLSPRPKELVYHPGRLVLPLRLQAHVMSLPDICDPALKLLRRELPARFGREVAFEHEKIHKSDTAFLLITTEDMRLAIPPELQDRLKGLKEQGYLLHVNDDRVVLAAKDAAGMRYGAITLLQALQAASPSAEEAQLPQLTIVDWPSLPIRAINIGLPTTRWGHPNDAPVPVDYFLDYLRRTVIEQKVNFVGLEVLQGMKYDRHPEIAGPAAWSKDDVRRVVSYLRESGVEVFPLLNSLGHANWLVIPKPELREDGDEHTLCTRHPQIRAVLTDCFDEVLEVFEPRYLHFGLDEVRWVTERVAPDKRCPRCRGVDKRELFVEHVKWLDEFARSRNVRPMMWADMVLREHNGGPPFHLADTLPRLPRDLIMCDWSTSLAPRSLWQLEQQGFEVIKSNSCGVNNAQAPSVIGNMWGIWARTPWLTESCWNIHSYCYLPQLVASEYSWNVYPDLMADSVPCRPDYFAQRPLLQKTVAARPEPTGGKTVTSLQPGTQTVEVSGLKLQPFAEPLAAAGSVAIDRPVSALYWLLAADLPEADRKSFLDEFKKAVHWRGVPIGELEVVFADGATDRQTLLYGTHVRAVPLDEPFPQAFEALGTTTVGSRLGYLCQWVNPRPDQPVAQLKFAPAATAARLLLLGLASRSVWPPR